MVRQALSFTVSSGIAVTASSSTSDVPLYSTQTDMNPLNSDPSPSGNSTQKDSINPSNCDPSLINSSGNFFSHTANLHLNIGVPSEAQGRVSVLGVSGFSDRWKLSQMPEDRCPPAVNLGKGDCLRTSLQCYTVPCSEPSSGIYSVIKYSNYQTETSNSFFSSIENRCVCRKFCVRSKCKVGELSGEPAPPKPLDGMEPVKLHPVTQQLRNLRLR